MFLSFSFFNAVTLLNNLLLKMLRFMLQLKLLLYKPQELVQNPLLKLNSRLNLAKHAARLAIVHEMMVAGILTV
ncbi:MAG: hypothetical protein QXR45_06990 [Candidatus Bathyarchaeia archaeon]